MTNKFSLENFKKWMDQHKEEFVCETKNGLVGMPVEPIILGKRLAAKITPDKDNLKMKLVKEFAEEGGTIISTTEEKFYVEVSSGNFYIHRAYVKRS